MSAARRRSSSSSNDTTSIDRFADYFVICGLDEKDGLEPHQSNGKELITLVSSPITSYFNFKLTPCFVPDCSQHSRHVKDKITSRY